VSSFATSENRIQGSSLLLLFRNASQSTLLGCHHEMKGRDDSWQAKIDFDWAMVGGGIAQDQVEPLQSDLEPRESGS